MKISTSFSFILAGIFFVGCAHLRHSDITCDFSDSEVNDWRKTAVELVTSPEVWKEHGVRITQGPLLFDTNRFEYKYKISHDWVEVTVPELVRGDKYQPQFYCVKVSFDRATGLLGSLREEKY